MACDWGCRPLITIRHTYTGIDGNRVFWRNFSTGDAEFVDMTDGRCRFLLSMAYPCAAFTESKHLFAKLVKRHTRQPITHAMMLMEPNVLASQEWTYRRVDVLERLKDDAVEKMHIVWNDEWFGRPRDKMMGKILSDLNAGWWAKSYDVLGIVGQLVWHKLNNPSKFYCSERVYDTLKIVEPDMSIDKPTPGDLYTYLTTRAGSHDVVLTWKRD